MRHPLNNTSNFLNYHIVKTESTENYLKVYMQFPTASAKPDKRSNEKTNNTVPLSNKSTPKSH